MSASQTIGLKLPIGSTVTLPGHFERPLILEHIRPLGPDGSSACHCRTRLPVGASDESVLSPSEAAVRASATRRSPLALQPLNPEQLRLLVESSGIRLACTHHPYSAVSLPGIRTLPHQAEAVYLRMLPQPRLRFLLADDPGVGNSITAGLPLKELRLPQAIKRILILCPAQLTIQCQDQMLPWFTESFDIIASPVDQLQLIKPLTGTPEMARVGNPAANLDDAKREILPTRFCEIPAEPFPDAGVRL